MNNLQVAWDQPKYQTENILVIKVDGDRLDLILHQQDPDGMYEGLVPFLSMCELDAAYADYAALSLPMPGTRVKVPILLCPDDVDLYCTVILADIEARENTVTWHRFGLDIPTPKAEAKGFRLSHDYWHKIGEKVSWIEGVGPFRFDRHDYGAELAKLKHYRAEWMAQYDLEDPLPYEQGPSTVAPQRPARPAGLLSRLKAKLRV